MDYQKLENEKYASKFAINSETSFIGLRFFSVYGPYGRPDMAYYAFTKAINNQAQLFLNNGGNASRDMTYIDDIVCGIEGAINLINQENIHIKMKFLIWKQSSTNSYFNAFA